MLLQIGPCLALLIMNTALVAIAFKKTQTAVNKGNIFIVVGVTVIFLSSTLPHFVYYLQNRDSWEDTVQLRRTIAVTFVSSFSNPVVYFLTNQRFSEFTNNFVGYRRIRVRQDLQMNAE